MNTPSCHASTVTENQALEAIIQIHWQNANVISQGSNWNFCLITQITISPLWETWPQGFFFPVDHGNTQ